jgi:hypothetical protein
MSSIVFSSSLTIADAKIRLMPHLILRHWLIFQQVCMQLEKSNELVKLFPIYISVEFFWSDLRKFSVWIV